MEKLGALNCSSELSTCNMGQNGGNNAQALFERLVGKNQEMLDRLRLREMRSNSIVQIFRDRHGALISEGFELGGELNELALINKRLISILRELQRDSVAASKICSSEVSVPVYSRRDSEDSYRNILQRLKETCSIANELSEEVNVLRIKNDEIVKSRETLLQLVEEKQTAVDSLERNAKEVSRSVTAWRRSFVSGDNSRELIGKKATLEGILYWSNDEQLSFRHMMDVMSSANSGEEERVTEALQLREVDVAARFYQSWNDKFMVAAGELMRLFTERHCFFHTHIEETKKNIKKT